MIPSVIKGAFACILPKDDFFLEIIPEDAQLRVLFVLSIGIVLADVDYRYRGKGNYSDAKLEGGSEVPKRVQPIPYVRPVLL